MREIKNAKIESTFLGREDHGIMTCFIHLEFNGGGQGFGGYTLDSYNEAKKKRIGTAFGIDFIDNILKVVGVDSWEELPGKYVRIDGDYGKIHRLGNITEDKWFSPQELADYHFYKK